MSTDDGEADTMGCDIIIHPPDHGHVSAEESGDEESPNVDHLSRQQL